MGGGGAQEGSDKIFWAWGGRGMDKSDSRLNRDWTVSRRSSNSLNPVPEKFFNI